MRTWLLVWNPLRSRWRVSRPARTVQSGRNTKYGSSCGVNKSIRTKDRIFLIRLGVEPRGIVGSGFATTRPRRGPAWRGKPNRKSALYIDVLWDALLDTSSDAPTRQRPLSLKRLQSGRLARVTWSTRASGITIPSDVAAELERQWTAHYESITGRELVQDLRVAPRFADFDEELSAVEGEQRRRLVLHRRRENSLRVVKIRNAIAHGRLACEVPGCGFEFARVYGALGAGFAEVHHRKPLASRKRPESTSLDELAIVCANCHRMIHKDGECRPLAGLIPRERRHADGNGRRHNPKKP
jgi:5-methylcytosine-specific restriction protein A